MFRQGTRCVAVSASMGHSPTCRSIGLSVTLIGCLKECMIGRRPACCRRREDVSCNGYESTRLFQQVVGRHCSVPKPPFQPVCASVSAVGEAQASIEERAEDSQSNWLAFLHQAFTANPRRHLSTFNLREVDCHEKSDEHVLQASK